MQISPVSPGSTSTVRIVERADGDLGAGQRQADRSFARRSSGGLQRCDRRGLAQAVALDQLAAARSPRTAASPRAAAARRRTCRYSSEERSKLPICGCLSMALNRVGTPGIMRRLAAWRSASSVSISSNCGSEDHLHALADAEIHHRGHGEDVEERKHADDAVARADDPVAARRFTWLTLIERLAWVSIAPLGVPVVPPVYCSTAIASGVIAGRFDSGRHWRAGPARRRSCPFARDLPIAASFARCSSLKPDRFQRRQQRGEARHHGLVESAALRAAPRPCRR